MPDKKNSDKSQLKQYIFVIRRLASRELRHGNMSSRLGHIWNIAIPFFDMITMSILFAKVFHNDIHSFVPYVFTGTIVYGFYSSGMFGCLSSLVSNRSLLIRTKLPKNLFVVEKLYMAFIHMSFSIVGYIIILIATGVRVGPCVLLFPIVVALSAFIILGIGKILAVVNVYFADIKYFYQIIMRLVFYASALFYNAAHLSPAMQHIIAFNPIYLSVLFARSCILYNQVPPVSVWIRLIIFAAVLYTIGTLVFKKGTQDIVAKL